MAWSGATAVLDADSTASRRIFISYRREDSEGHVLALVVPLRERVGEERVFRDIDSIPAGKDFVAVLQQELASCSVMLVVIGRNWLTSRRLDDPADLVRIEVATALANPRMLVVPVLVGGARMPAAAELPPNLQPLARRQSFELTSSHWNQDIKNLIDEIEAASADPAESTKRSTLLLRRGVQIAAGVVLCTLLMFWVLERIGVLPFSRDTGSAQQSQAGAPAVAPAPPAKSDQESSAPPSDADRQPPPASGPSDPRKPPAPDRKPLTDERAALRDAEATAARRRQRAEAEKASERAMAAGKQKQLDAERLRDAGQTDRAIQSFLAAAAEFDTAADATRIEREERARTKEDPGHQDQAAERNREEAAIRQTLEQFRLAYSQKNANALRGVFPQVRADRLFENLEVCARVSLTFGEMSVTLLSPTNALVDVQATYGCQPPTGQPMQVSKPVRDTFRLARNGTVWVIERRQITLDGG
jgi:hypothetical protein